MALSLPHRPDVTLLHKSRREQALPENTARALSVALQASQQPLATRVEELRGRLLQPDPSWLDFNQWVDAMGKLHQEPGREAVSRMLRPKATLQWRTEPLNSPILGRSRPPPRVSQELKQLLEREVERRSTAICAPNTKPEVRQQLIKEEELLDRSGVPLPSHTAAITTKPPRRKAVSTSFSQAAAVDAGSRGAPRPFASNTVCEKWKKGKPHSKQIE